MSTTTHLSFSYDSVEQPTVTEIEKIGHHTSNNYVFNQNNYYSQAIRKIMLWHVPPTAK